MEALVAVVLAAGKGTRMKSDLPKVLVPVAGRPMIDYVLDTLEACRTTRSLVVVGYEAERVKDALAARQNVEFVLQSPQLGTGHAVKMCVEALRRADPAGTGTALIVTGDSPLVQAQSLQKLLDERARTGAACILGSAHKSDPRGMGRIVRNSQGEFLGIVEERDATPEQRQITEVNLSCYVFGTADLLWSLDRLTNDNQQGEYYITDCPGLLLAAGKKVQALPVLQPRETLSINTPEELAAVEAALASA